MACSCGKAKNRGTYKVTLPGGLVVNKSTQEAATSYAAKHPGSTVKKV